MRTKTIDTTTKRGMNRLNMLIHAGRWSVVTAGKRSVTVARNCPLVSIHDPRYPAMPHLANLP